MDIQEHEMLIVETHNMKPTFIIWQTVSELDTTKQRQEKTASKSSEAQHKASTERTHIKHELDTVKDALSTIS